MHLEFVVHPRFQYFYVNEHCSTLRVVLSDHYFQIDFIDINEISILLWPDIDTLRGLRKTYRQ